MSLLTAIYKFIKPELTDAPPDITATNPNWDKLDATLKEIEDAHSSHLAEEAAHAELVDRTITVGVGKDFGTIQDAVNSLKKRLEADITIQVDPGTYNESVTIAGFQGKGRLYLKGGTNITEAVSHKINRIKLEYNATRIDIYGVSIISTNTSALVIATCAFVKIKYCNISSAANYDGIYIYEGSFVTVEEGTNISNRKNAIAVSNAICYSNSITGTGNTIGLQAIAGIIHKGGTQPGGTTAESILNGGVIR